MCRGDFDARVDFITDGHNVPVVLVATGLPPLPCMVDDRGFSRYPTIGRTRPRGRNAAKGLIFWSRQAGMPVAMPSSVTLHTSYADAIAAALMPVDSADDAGADDAGADDAGADDAGADDAGDDDAGWAYPCGFTVHWFHTESAARAAHAADWQRVLDGEYPSGCLGSVEPCSHREAADWAAPHTPNGEW